LAVVAKPSIYYVLLIIGCLRWTGIARLVRAEMLRIRDLQYIEAAKVLGLGKWRIWGRHALPNGLRPVWAALAFGMAGAILVEASLSFLGIGLPVETVTWGSLMRQLPAANLRPWWLAVFPGLAIFMTVLAFNALGEALADKAFRL
jgi:peptide/nickel transport system permease protein